ncbi:hypothetical protein M422DRAFT_249221 [Sphaerobolus stellatus SS14]|nr:hypothetical protein M422DRAFT_249221 [Sphaerobolus stellatus SS14]
MNFVLDSLDALRLFFPLHLEVHFPDLEELLIPGANGPAEGMIPSFLMHKSTGSINAPGIRSLTLDQMALSLLPLLTPQSLASLQDAPLRPIAPIQEIVLSNLLELVFISERGTADALVFLQTIRARNLDLLSLQECYTTYLQLDYFIHTILENRSSSLTSLQLHKVYISKSDVEAFRLYLPLLEHLCIDACEYEPGALKLLAFPMNDGTLRCPKLLYTNITTYDNDLPLEDIVTFISGRVKRDKELTPVDKPGENCMLFVFDDDSQRRVEINELLLQRTKFEAVRGHQRVVGLRLKRRRTQINQNDARREPHHNNQLE